MRVFIPTTAYPPRCRAIPYLQASGVDFVVVVHGPADRRRLVDAFGSDLQCAEHGCPFEHPIERICWIRDWIDTELVQSDEWYGMMDDKVANLTEIRFNELGKYATVKEAYATLGWTLFDRDVPPSEVPAILAELVSACERRGTFYGGLAPSSNPLFRLYRWKKRGYSPARFCVTKRLDDLPWTAFGPENCWIHYEDFVRIAHIVARCGHIVIDQWRYPWFRKGGSDYWKHGLGRPETRTDNVRRTADLLDQRFPGLVEFKQDKSRPSLRFI